MTALPAEAWAAALAALPGMFPGRLAAVLGESSPPEAWARVAEGSWAGAGDQGAAARRAAQTFDVAGYWARHRDAGVGVAVRTSAAMPAALAADIDAPAVV